MEPSGPCVYCQIAAIRQANRGHQPVGRLLELQSIYRPCDRFTLLKDVTTIHTDHGTQFTSDDFAIWCKSQKIQLKIAAPRRLSTNGKAEAAWSHIRMITFKILQRARLTHTFSDCALKYAWQIKNVLPLRVIYHTEDDESVRPTTPYEKYFGSR
jgi:transposase InsO family protein